MKATIVALALALTCLFPAASQAAPNVRVGEVLPDETFRTLDGRELKLSSFRGKTLLLTFAAPG